MRRSYLNRNHVSIYDYDARSLLGEISHRAPASAIINDFVYPCARADRRTGMKSRDIDAQYQYNGLGGRIRGTIRN